MKTYKIFATLVASAFGLQRRCRLDRRIHPLRADEAHPSELLAAYVVAVRSLEAAPECLDYELGRCEEDERAFVLRIHWTSTASHLVGFRKGPHFPPFLGAIRAFVPEIAEMRHYEVTPLAWTRPGP